MTQFSAFSEEFATDPHAVFERMRREQPVYRSEEGDRAVVSLFSYWDCRTALGQAQTFSSQIPEMRDLFLGEAEIVIQEDAPRHTGHRRMAAGFVAGAAGRAAVIAFETKLRSLLQECAGSWCEFSSAIAAKAAIEVTGQLIGVPPSDYNYVRDWTIRLAAAAGGEILQTDIESLTRQKDEVSRLHVELTGYLEEMRTSRASFPQGSVIDTATRENWPEDEYLGYAKLLLFASNHTSAIQLTSAAYLIAMNADIATGLQKGNLDSQHVVEEMFRYKPVFRVMNRRAQIDTTVSGVDIRRGDDVLAWIASANRDDLAFEMPHIFDPGRVMLKPHLGFGYGPHFCLGAHIARAELKILLKVLGEESLSIKVGVPTVDSHDPWVDSFSALPTLIHEIDDA
jgi:cytochrome P450